MTEISFDLSLMKNEIFDAINRFNARGLKESSKWLCDLLCSLTCVESSHCFNPVTEWYEEIDVYFAAKAYFDDEEFSRCAHITKNCEHSLTSFLHFYSRYKSCEKFQRESSMNSNHAIDASKDAKLKQLKDEMSIVQSAKEDACFSYLFGLILKKLNCHDQAIAAFVRCITKDPMLWSAWTELCELIPDVTKLSDLPTPKHWIKDFFFAYANGKMTHCDEALEIYDELQRKGFRDSKYILSQMAIIYHQENEKNKALECFETLEKMDPFRVEDMDTYSNLLYVVGRKIELSNLAHRTFKIDKYRKETCCIVGNFYSLRGEHQKAVLYFQRALKLDPTYFSSWILMGHEFMELRNTNAAIRCYRQAIEVNPRDFRAWYGLGQTYEILKMYSLSVCYYKEATKLRSNDSRMLIALGETYEKLNHINSALKCFYKACRVGDVERMALNKLAKLYDRLAEFDNAAAAYRRCINMEVHNDDDPDAPEAYIYLANYHLQRNELDEANSLAYKCLEYLHTKTEAKSIIKTIAFKREKPDRTSSVVGLINRIGLDNEMDNDANDVWTTVAAEVDQMDM